MPVRYSSWGRAPNRVMLCGPWLLDPSMVDCAEFPEPFDEWYKGYPFDGEVGPWPYDQNLVDRTAPPTYSRSLWHQEYKWCEIGQYYLCRGYWATVSYNLNIMEDPIIIYAKRKAV